MVPRFPLVLLTAAVLLGARSADAQSVPASPPAVGVVRVERRPVTETSEFVGRIQAIDRVNLVARVSAFLDRQLFTEGAEVKKGDLLYVLEQPPFQADVQAKQAAVQQAEAQLRNANITLNRALTLLKTPAGNQSVVDNARAAQLSNAAQLLAAQAQLKQSEINLGYAEIRAPIAGKIGRTAVTAGNVVGPGSGTLTTIVSQDPMYVVFPISLRTGLELRQRYADAGGFNAVVIRIRLPDGRLYKETGKLNFVNNTVSTSTDTILLRGTIANPPIVNASVGGATVRELVDGEFVTVLLQGVEPVELLAIPRAAVLSDQQGDYVFTLDAQNKVRQARVHLGQSTPGLAMVTTGLAEGEMVIVDGVQRVHAGEVVLPGPASPPPGAPAGAMQGGAAPAPAGGPASGTPTKSGTDPSRRQ